MIGQTISHYKIIDKIGEGGMGIVYKAQDLNLDRFVALKFLPERLSNSEQDRARFLQEAKAASALNHPNICTIHGIEEHDKQMFIVMELVEGQTLNEKKSSISFKQAIDIGIQLADGLAVAHEKGIVHRDIKPDNIMIRKDGIAQIMDFGLAKLRGVSRLTKEGSTVGTAGYMSPEQVQGQDADHRSDIFSLGVLLYELFTGQLPFRGVHETALMYEIVNVDPPPMSAVKPDIDPALDAIILECMEKDPNERTQSVKQIAIDLKRFKRESSRTRVSMIRPAMKQSSVGVRETHPASASTKNKMPWIVSIALALVTVIALWAPWQTSEPPITIQFSVPVIERESLDMLDQLAIAISEDGSKIVYRTSEHLILHDLRRFESMVIPGTEKGHSPFFSPDGRWVGFFSGSKLKKVMIGGGVPLDLAGISPQSRGASWNRNGTIVFVPAFDVGLSLIHEGGGTITQLTVPDSARMERTHRWPSFLPDGKTVLFTVATKDRLEDYEDATIEAVNIETKARKFILKGASMARYVPGARRLVYSHLGVLFAAPFDADRLEITGKAEPMVNGINGDITSGAMHFAFAQNGTLVYFPGQIGQLLELVQYDREGRAHPIPLPTGQYQEPRYSPDGKKIAFALRKDKGPSLSVYDLERGTLTRLTYGDSSFTPAWSRNGSRIAYYVIGANSGIYATASDGSGTPELLMPRMPGASHHFVYDWTHDGSAMVIQTYSGSGDLYVLSLDGTKQPKAFEASKYYEWGATLSPDDRYIAYVTDESGQFQIVVRPFPEGNGKWQISTQGGTEPRWSKDGKTLYYNYEDKIMSVRVTTKPKFSAETPQVLWTGIHPLQSAASAMTYDVSPDEKWFITTRGIHDGETNQIRVLLNGFSELKEK